MHQGGRPAPDEAADVLTLWFLQEALSERPRWLTRNRGNRENKCVLLFRWVPVGGVARSAPAFHPQGRQRPHAHSTADAHGETQVRHHS